MDPGDTPLANLTNIQSRIDQVKHFISTSLTTNTILPTSQIHLISTEITSALTGAIVNGAALISTNPSSHFQHSDQSCPTSNTFFKDNNNNNINLGPNHDFNIQDFNSNQSCLNPNTFKDNINLGSLGFLDLPKPEARRDENIQDFNQSCLNSRSFKDATDLGCLGFLDLAKPEARRDEKREDFNQSCVNIKAFKDDIDIGCLGFLDLPKPESREARDDDSDIVELDAVELLAEHLHFCDYCGKGFKRDANLRMHMRAHGNKYKTLEALSKPEKLKFLGDSEAKDVKRRKFSCPFVGCGRNKLSKKFRPLKSVICVKNHFKRSHCPKMYNCNRCEKKSFSVVADLKSHLKHCGESKWKCSCGTSFSRKDKLFGHIALFEGHMPAMMAPEVAVVEVDDGKKAKGAVVVEDEDVKGVEWVDDDVLFDGLGLIDDGFCLQDVLGGGGGSMYL